MADTIIRITSNPYVANDPDHIVRPLAFYRWDDGWKEINSATDPSSGLIKSDILNGFLPIKAKQIVDLICREYGLKTTIVFEGPEDEYGDLQIICSDACYEGKLKLTYGERDLANANRVLPNIIALFNEVETLLEAIGEDNASIRSDIIKLKDVSKNQVPLCVVGNYSAGKSTFINALIGYEILPSAVEPNTAKVLMIVPSQENDTATVSFGKDDGRCQMQFDQDGLRLEESAGDAVLLGEVSSYLESDYEAKSLDSYVRRTIQLLNEYSSEANESEVIIPDLIEIRFPINPIDSWTNGHSFVIFDTPGSNSATDIEHLRVLREQLKSLSNGLIIYLAKADTLNTNDNDALCDFVRSIDAMDDRFTMVVVNQADLGYYPLDGFSEEDEQKKLDQAVCSRLEPQGLFYASSLIALGAKIEGRLNNVGDAAMFNRMQSKFINNDPDGLGEYTELYRYNIMPIQKKKQSIAESSACENRLLANSGLYCIEREIELFANRYSAYNKCQQAEMLLRRVIKTAAIDLDDEKRQLEEERARTEEQLRRDKRDILLALRSSVYAQKEQALNDYEEKVLGPLSCDHWLITKEKLKTKQSSYTEDSSKKLGLEYAQGSERDARRVAREHLASRIREAAQSRSVDALRDAFEGAAEDVGKVRSKKARVEAKLREVDRQVSEDLLTSVRDSFTKSFEVMTSDIEVRSKKYWSERSESVRQALYIAATGSTVLPEEKRREIADVIINYQTLSLNIDAEEIFVKSELEETLRILNYVVRESDRLDLRKVLNTYNDGMVEAFDTARKEISDAHIASFLEWLNSLMTAINLNIESYNPALEELAKSIGDLSGRIQEHEKNLAELSEHLNTVSQLIGWRKRG